MPAQLTGSAWTCEAFCYARNKLSRFTRSLSSQSHAAFLSRYHFDGVVKNWVADNVQTFYKQYVTPLLHAGQKLVLVPASFSSDVNHKCDKYAVAAQLIK